LKKLLALLTTAFLLVVFAIVVSEPLRLGLPEGDLWWMMPAMSIYTKGRSFAGVAYFLLGPLPVGFAQPILKLYLHAGSSWLGPETRWLILVSIGAHVICSWLMVRFSRLLGLDQTSSWLAAILYFSGAAYFQAFLWPPAFQHLFAILTILLLLVLYLETEARIARGSPWAGMFAAALAVGLAASLQRSAFIAPALIGTHLLFCSKDSAERVRRYVRWILPLGCAYLIYQGWVLTQAGDPVVTEVLRKMPFPEGVKPYLVVDPIEPNPIAPWVRTLVVWLAGAAGLSLGAVILRISQRIRMGRRMCAALLVVVCVGFYVVWSRQDSRQILLPYNLLTPLLAALACFLEPIQAVLSSSSTEAFHYIPAMISPWSILLTLSLIGFFWKTLLPRNRALILLPAWVLLTAVLTIHQNSSFPIQMPSRYFIYISPVVCILLATALTACFDCGPAGRRNRPWVRDVLLCAVVCAVGFSNLAATRLAWFRGRLANTYSIYDDLRMARLIEEDLRSLPKEVVVAGVLPVPLREQWPHLLLEVPGDYDNLGFTARALAKNPPIRGIHPGVPLPPGVVADYQVKQQLLLNRAGEEVDPFERITGRAMKAWDQGQSEQARRLLMEAVQFRPFLFRYLLGPLRLMDVQWLTEGMDFQDWLNQIDERNEVVGRIQAQKVEQIRSVIHRELSDFILSLVLISYLDDQDGKQAESQYWFSWIKLLDRDPERLIHRLEAYPRVRKDPAVRIFLRKKAHDPFFFIEPFFWKKEDYAFGRFLVRLLLHRDIRSSWDRRFGAVL